MHALICAVALTAAAHAAPGDWVSSAELVQRKTLVPAKTADIDAALKRLPKGIGLIRDYVTDPDVAVYRHAGDLTIDRSFSNDDVVIVEGNLVVQGDYDDYSPGIGVLLVLGDMQVDDVMSWGSLAVTGKLASTGLVYANYNDFTFEVGGDITARALVVSDKSGDWNAVKADVVQTDNGWNSADALRRFVPELVIDSLLDRSSEDDGVEAQADWDVANKRIRAQQPLFRDTPAPASLVADAGKLIDPKTDAATVAKLAASDRLLALVAAAREKPALALQRQFVAQNDAAVLERLAANPGVDKDILAQIAKAQPSASAVAAQNPNAPASLVAPMARSTDPAVRIATLEHPKVADAELATLAADTDATVRLALVQSRHVRRLVATDIARLAADNDAKVRAELPERGVLTVAQYAALAGDADDNVRLAVAESLKRQALWRELPLGTPAEREAIAAKLAGDTAAQVRATAIAAAAPAEQEKLATALAATTKIRIDAELAETTRNVALMRRYAEADATVAESLAENLALPPSVQRRLVERLPPASTPRPRPSLFAEPDAKTRTLEQFDDVIDELVQNPNAAPATLAAVAEYCKAVEARARFCNTLLDRDDLAATIFDTLADVGDPEFREDWALTAIGSPYAQRHHLVAAVPRWYDDEAALLAEFKTHAKRGDDAAFLTALAGSSHDQLREIAARNQATPPALIVKLRGDTSDDVRSIASANPSLPREAMEKAIAAPSWLLANPNVPDALVRSLRERALAEDDTVAADDALELLAARALRATGE